MHPHPPVLFVLVDASRWQESAQALSACADPDAGDGQMGPEVLVMGGGEHPPCVLLRSTDLDGVDARLGEWMLATAARFADARTRYADLTPRERQALPLITDGLLNKQAASEMGISEATLQIHRRRIMDKMGARSFAELVRMADVLGLSGGARPASAREAARSRRIAPRPRPRRLGGSAA